MDQSETKWCPECGSYYLHVKGFCLGCDVDQKEWFNKSEQEVADSIGIENNDWLDMDWVVASEDGPLHGTETKKEGVEKIGSYTGEEEISMSRLSSGLYCYVTIEGETYYVGKPEAYQKEDLSHLIDPDPDE